MAPNWFSGSQPRVYYGWIIVGLCFVNLGIAFGVWYSFSVFFLALMHDFGWSRASAASIFSVFTLCNATTGPLSGRLLDRFGPRLVIPLGAALLSLALVLVSFTHSLWFFRLSYGVMAGVGVSLMGFTTNSALLSRWFERGRGTAVGVAVSGIGLGMMVLSPLVERWIATLGWRTAYLCLAALVAALVIPLNLILARPNPAALGQEMDGGARPPKPRRRPPTREMRVANPEWAYRQWTLGSAMRTRPFWLLMASYGFGSLCIQSTMMHAASAMVDAGLSLRTAAVYMGLLGICSSVGKVLFGFLSDRLGREMANTITTAICTAGLLAIMLISPQLGFLALLFAVFFGVGYGGTTPIYPAAAADLFMGGSFGLIFAVLFMSTGLGGSLGPYISGLLRDATGGYVASFCLSIVFLLGSCILLWLSGPGKVRRVVRTTSDRSAGGPPGPA